MNGSASSTDPTHELSGHWWQSVTLTELAQTSAVMDGFIGESAATPDVTPAQFARAVALHLLCKDAGIVDPLIARADARSATLAHALQLDGDVQSSDVDAYEAWLTRRRAIGTGLKACAALLSSPLREAIEAKVDGFIQITTEHQHIFISLLFGRGLQKPVVAPSLASFRKRARRAGD